MKYIRRDSPGVVTDRWPSEGRPSGRGAEGGAVAVRRTAVGGGTHAGGPPQRGMGIGLREQSRHRALDRRTVLRGAFGAVLGLPFLEAMLPRARADCGNGFPKRFGLFFWGNGNLPDYWNPSADGADWPMSEQLAPLTDVKDLITVVSGLSVKIPNLVPHTSGSAGLLSAAPVTYVGTDETFAAPTIDQVIARVIGTGSLFPSLQTAATHCNGVSYNGPSSRNPPETDPLAFYERIFGSSFRQPGDAVDPTLALRQSVLDSVLEDATTLRARVSAGDQVRLDQHLQGLYELEQRLARLQEDPPSLDACGRPESPTADFSDVEGRPAAEARSRAMCDILAMALACDQTRVFGHYFSDPVSEILYGDLPYGHHELTHNEAQPQPMVNEIVTMITGEFAYLVARFRDTPEGDGTLLDNCLVMGCSEVSLGQTHSLDDLPIVLAGSACGAIRQGIHYRSYTGDNATRLLITLQHAFDIPVTTFGTDEATETEGISEIEA